MRVLHLASGHLFGGVESMLATIARAAGLQVDLRNEFAVCFEGRLATELQSAGATVHLLPGPRASRPLTVLRARRAFRRLARRERYDAVVVHSSWLHAIFGPALREGSGRLVTWMHAASTGRHWTERLAARHTPDVVVANSEHTRASAGRLFPATASHVVYCPVEDRSTSVRSQRDVVRYELSAGDDALVIVCNSRLEAWKGHAPLLKAAAQLGDTVPWQLWISGAAATDADRAYEMAIRELALRLDIAQRVRFLGERRDVWRLLAGADVYCQANLAAEAFGIAFIEAMYAGIPVVGSAIGGTVEVITGDTGILCPPGDVASLANALRRLARDDALRRELGLRGQARAAALCDPASQLRRFSALLHETRVVLPVLA